MRTFVIYSWKSYPSVFCTSLFLSPLLALKSIDGNCTIANKEMSQGYHNSVTLYYSSVMKHTCV